MALKKHLATITILVKDRQSHAVEVQKILTEHGHIIMARLGVNPSRLCIKHCTGVMALIVEGTTKEINALSKELDDFYGIVAKTTIIA
ncbi:MAG: CopG family transcriptional regulator [Parcubacteria group bacterium]|nr:MAG: CopG family transcriptional regulator [Parcubacteria group bacterium]